ncbi:hypothetical protein ACNKHT_03470 [Shigella flexneri]
MALVPTAWLLICTLTAGWQKAFSPDAKVGFLAIANGSRQLLTAAYFVAVYSVTAGATGVQQPSGCRVNHLLYGGRGGSGAVLD